jgi:hypothetical protein
MAGGSTPIMAATREPVGAHFEFIGPSDQVRIGRRGKYIQEPDIIKGTGRHSLKEDTRRHGRLAMLELPVEGRLNDGQVLMWERKPI